MGETVDEFSEDRSFTLSGDDSLRDDVVVESLDQAADSSGAQDYEVPAETSTPQCDCDDEAIIELVEVIDDGIDPADAKPIASDEHGAGPAGDAPKGDAHGKSGAAGDEAVADEAAADKASGVSRVRELAKFRVDGELVRRVWAATSLGRIALTCVGVFVIVVASAYFFVMQPIKRDMHAVSEQKSLLHDYVVIQQAGATIGAFKDGLMTGDQRLTVMSEVRLMAEGSGVRIIGDPELLLRRQVSGKLADYPIRLRVKGQFHEIGEFLSLLEASPRFIVVESVEITSDVASSSGESDATVLLDLAAWEE